MAIAARLQNRRQHPTLFRAQTCNINISEARPLGPPHVSTFNRKRFADPRRAEQKPRGLIA